MPQASELRHDIPVASESAIEARRLALSEHDPLFDAEPLPAGRGLRLMGELDVSTAGYLAAMLDSLPRHGQVTIDLSQLSFMDSSGLHIFERYAGSLDGAGPLVVEHASANIRRVFEITGVDQNPNIELRNDADDG